MYKHTLISLLVLTVLLVPSAAAEEALVQGITLHTSPNAVAVSWEAPQGIEVSHYRVHYAAQSLLENNGRFDGMEETLGDETSLVLMDLENRGFVNGDAIYITVTTVKANGTESMALAQEQSTSVNIPGTEPQHTVSQENTNTMQMQNHGVASPYRLLGAIAEDLTTVKLTFSAPMTLTLGNPVAHFSITEEGSNNPIGILTALGGGNTVTLQTLPMRVRSHYRVTVQETLKTADGSSLDPVNRSAVFVAREGTTVSPATQAPAPTPLSPVQTQQIPDAQGGPEPELLELPPIPSLEGMVTTPEPPKDTTPPENAQNLILRKKVQQNGSYTVYASWEESLDTAHDLASYNLYESANRGMKYVGPTALLATVTSATISNVPPGTLTLKITTKDRTGNESAGIVETIILPETGPALLLLLSGMGAGTFTVLKRRKLRYL